MKLTTTIPSVVLPPPGSSVLRQLPQRFAIAAFAVLVVSIATNQLWFVNGDVCKSDNSVPCEQYTNLEGDNVKSYGFMGAYYCIDDGCNLMIGKNVTKEICGVSIDGIKECVVSSSVTSKPRPTSSFFIVTVVATIFATPLVALLLG